MKIFLYITIWERWIRIARTLTATKVNVFTKEMSQIHCVVIFDQHEMLNDLLRRNKNDCNSVEYFIQLYLTVNMTKTWNIGAFAKDIHVNFNTSILHK
jgi:hypothetical protein